MLFTTKRQAFKILLNFNLQPSGNLQSWSKNDLGLYGNDKDIDAK